MLKRSYAACQPKTNKPTSWLGIGYYLIKQIIQVCYLIQNMHHTVSRLLCAYFTFFWGTQSLRLFRWRKLPKSKSLWEHASLWHPLLTKWFTWEQGAGVQVGTGSSQASSGLQNTKQSTSVLCVEWPFQVVLFLSPESLMGSAPYA